MDLEILNDINTLAIQYKAKLLPVIKDKKYEDIKKVYDQGFREFGENRIEQLLEHREKFNDSKFHFIAPLQSRKISQIMEKILVLCAHPDDEALGMGGAISLHAKDGDEVFVVFFADGETSRKNNPRGLSF